MNDDPGLPASKELAKVANNLVNKISKAVGVLYEPTHIKRIAKAKAKAAVIEAEGEVQVTATQRRAFDRWLQEEERNQRNMEAVTQLAIEHLKPDAKPEQINDDWLVDLFEKVKKVSDADMQKLWARILAGEANALGSFSKATLHTLSIMHTRDAAAFAILARFAVTIDGSIMPIISNLGHEIYNDLGVNYELLLHLASMNLIHVSEVTELAIYIKGDRMISYHKWTHKLGADVETFDIGHAAYTAVGVELVRLCEQEFVPGFTDYLEGRIKKQTGAAQSSPGAT